MRTAWPALVLVVSFVVFVLAAWWSGALLRLLGFAFLASFGIYELKQGPVPARPHELAWLFDSLLDLLHATVAGLGLHLR